MLSVCRPGYHKPTVVLACILSGEQTLPQHHLNLTVLLKSKTKQITQGGGDGEDIVRERQIM